MTGRIGEALAQKSRVWGGWIVGPTVLGPQAYAQAGYDYVGFDCQHGYLDDADVALLLSRLEHVPVATAVRLPSAAPAPIGRVLDAGADAIIVAMVERPEQAAEAVSATRFAPRGVRSFGPLRASLGADVDALESRVDVYAMVETRRGVDAVDDVAAVPGLAGIYVGPADLAISMGFRPTTAWREPAVLDAMARVVDRAGAAGLPTGVHAGDGAVGATAAAMGFRIITLASESQALRHGVAAHLATARADSGTDAVHDGGYR